jgi:hypothetical protein
MRNILLTYATDQFVDAANALVSSAREVGFDECRLYGPNHLKNTEFYEKNRKILDIPRGGGYWLWKPYIISEAIKNLDANDCLFYCDAGRSHYYKFTKMPKRLLALARAKEKGFLLGPQIPHLGTISNWTKRDCLHLMGADTDKLLGSNLLMTWSIWRNTAAAKDFLNIWLDYCCDPRCLTDEPNVCGIPNHSDFRDHRHDQSILSILAHQQHAPSLDFTNTMVHKLIEKAPNSSLAHNFYKRPENMENLMHRDNPLMLLREHVRIKQAEKSSISV